MRRMKMGDISIIIGSPQSPPFSAEVIKGSIVIIRVFKDHRARNPISTYVALDGYHGKDSIELDISTMPLLTGNCQHHQ